MSAVVATHSLRARERWGLVLFAVVCGSLLLDLPLFVYLHVSASMLPKFSAVGLSVLAIAAGGLRGLPSGRVLALGAAVVLYCSLCVLALSWTSSADAGARELITRFTSSGILLLASVVTVSTRNTGQRAILAGLALLAVLGLLADIANGYAWTTVPGRAAGTFANPNIAAASTMILGLLGLEAVPARFRGVFFGVVAIGVMSTLSRGGYLMILASTLVLLAGRTLEWRSLLRGVAALGLLIVVAWSVASRTVLADRPELALLEVVDPVALLRLDAGDATSATERQEVAAAAIELFNEAPFLGSGLTATTTWTLPVSTHNQVLRVAAELGVVGVAAFALLIGTIIGGGQLWRTPAGRAAILWLIILIVVSHNVLEDWSHLAGLGVLHGLQDAGDGSTHGESEIQHA